jgi:ATP-dependent DNA helicase RecQ
MMTTAPASPRLSVAAAVAKFWGYNELKPLQDEAIQAGIEGQDSLVVLPTGGGKSLCYQVPPLISDRTDVVVSPLIALMKDQVDGLRACGYPAAALYSGMDDEERRRIGQEMSAGRLRLLFVSPERLLTPSFIQYLQRAGVSNFAIDEAHCISQWGHDFRPEYRRLAELRQHFPSATIHAFTATATERVRKDIVAQLKLQRPRLLVGRFDRPNLTYRIVQRRNLDAQIVETLRRHKDEAAIVYCISRADTEKVADMLKAAGFRAAAYHAGMDPRSRNTVQDAFARERLDVVVATVAFGMGIDRSNVRCVIHAAMPKSIEHYQQETGRSGRDGLDAECVLFHSPGDARRWELLFNRSASETGQPQSVVRAQLELLDEMESFCALRNCRHQALSAYFGQPYEASNCNACDVCLSDAAPVLSDGAAIARQIVECVLSLKLPFGVGYVADVLAGANLEKIRSRNHDKLSGYGAFAPRDRREVQGLVMQLVEQGVLHRSGGDRPVLTVTQKGRALIQGELELTLRAPEEPEREQRADPGWEGVDRELFEALRTLRRAIADERGVPPFVIFGDMTLRELARVRPVTAEAFLSVKGVGERKQADFGERFVAAIAAHCKENQATSISAAKRSNAATDAARAEAFRLFEQGQSLDDVAEAISRSVATVSQYLEDYVDERRPESVEAWVPAGEYERIVAAAQGSEDGRLKPVFQALGEQVPYEKIRVAMKHAGLR